MTRKNHRLRLLFIAALSLAALLSVFFFPRIAQDTNYHQFADRRSLIGIPNLINTISSILFVLVGGFGIWFLAQRLFSDIDNRPESRGIDLPYLVFFAGVFLIGFGSAYYHLAPDNSRLVWDRLPMTVAFMSFACAMITERIALRTGLALFLPLLILGMSSVIYWHWSEQAGTGDLRFYILVQFYPLLLILLVLFLFPAKYTRSWDIFIVILLYALSKVSEALDSQIYSLGQLVSGHSIKHLLAALAAYWVLRMIRKREYLGEIT